MMTVKCKCEGCGATKQRFKVVDSRGARLAGPFSTYAEAIRMLAAVRNAGVVADVKAVGK